MKLYADEAGADTVRRIEVLICSAVARVEVPAAIWRKHRTGGLDAANARTLVRAFEADYQGSTSRAFRFVAVAVTDAILAEAARLVATHTLRAYDAIQLASALAARQADEECSSFLAFDSELLRAAAAEGFDLPA